MQEEWIDFYLAGQLSEEEKAAFERRLQEDSKLKAEVEVYKNIVENLKSIRNQELKARLVNLESSIPKQRNKYGKSRYYIFYSLLIISGLVCFWILGNSIFKDSKIPSEEAPKPPSPSIQMTNPQEASPVIKEDTNLKQKQPNKDIDIRKKTERLKPVASNEMDGETYAVHFEPYIDEDLNSIVRGEGEKTNYEKFIAAYLAKNYSVALTLYDGIDESIRDSDNLLFLKANILLGLKRSNEARVILEQIVKNDQSRYTAEAKMYLQYCH
ncbi:MAG TPA: hypothetical protein PK622_06195 [Saprospiraceae bacterium]|nr:hypothetical protein [Saprospiraceae bacterium]